MGNGGKLAEVKGNEGSMDSEVEQRIGMASKIIGAIGRTILGKKELTKGTKV